MPPQPNDELLTAMEKVFHSHHPYVNNTLKRLAKAAYDRINGKKKATT